MTASDEACFEAQMRAAFAKGELAWVATRLLDRHGPALLAFLCDRLRDRSEAREVYGQFCEDLWKGLPSFSFRASLRSWAFTLARNAASRHVRDPRRRRARNLPLPDDSSIGLEASVTSGTPTYHKTDFKHRLRELRRQLPEQDQTLLILRVDQRLSWIELASVFAGDIDALAREERQRDAMRLRQRFKRVKEQLRRTAQAEGLLSSES